MWNHHAGWFQPPRMPNELPALCGLIRNFSAAPRQQKWGKEKVALLDRSRLFGNFPLILFTEIKNRRRVEISLLTKAWFKQIIGDFSIFTATDCDSR